MRKPELLAPWQSPTDALDISQSLAFLSHVNTLADYEPEVLPLRGPAQLLDVDLAQLRFCTLFGITALAVAIGKALRKGIAVRVKPPTQPDVRGFMSYFGFDSVLSRARRAGTVVLQDTFAERESSFGSRVFRTRPIYSLVDAEEFQDPESILQWISRLDSDIRDAEFFARGRFSRIVAGELSVNIPHHADLIENAQAGFADFGIVAIRVVKTPFKSSAAWLINTFGEQAAAFLKANADRGFAELCVCDPGPGIVHTLGQAYSKRLAEFSGENPVHPHLPHGLHRWSTDVVQFAFDELGTSKPDTDQWMTEEHALSRILSLVDTYGAILNVYTSNVHLTYDGADAPFPEARFGLGYEGRSQRCECNVGTFIQLLVPLWRSQTVPITRRPRTSSLPAGSSPSYPREHLEVVSIGSEFSDDLLRDATSFRTRSEMLLRRLMRKTENHLVILDFSHAPTWKVDQVGLLLSQLASLFLKRTAILVGVDEDIAFELESPYYEYSEDVIASLAPREAGGPASNAADNDKIPYTHSLAFLGDFYKTIPAVDAQGTLHWFGLPSLPLRTALTSLLHEEGSISDICGRTRAYASIGCEPPHAGALENILRSSRQIFYPYWIDESEGALGWKSALSAPFLEECSGKALVAHLERHLTGSEGSWWGGATRKEAFLIPHRKEYAEAFVECGQLLQQHEFCREAAQVLARQIHYMLEEAEPSVLVCSTAPTLLLANALRPRFRNRPFVLDAGHYFDERQKEVLRSLGDTDNVVVVQDIVDTGRTVGDNILVHLHRAQARIAGVACLIEFSEGIDLRCLPGRIVEKEFGAARFKLPCASVFRMRKPRLLTQDDLSEVAARDRYWVEPYSLHPFREADINTVSLENIPKDTGLAKLRHKKAIEALEHAQALRFGHFVFEAHHFSLVTCMRQLFEETALSNHISAEVVDIIEKLPGEPVIIFPLHSHIRYLVPSILDLVTSRGLKAPHVFATMVRELGPRPYYMIPHRLESLIEACHRSLANEDSVQKLSVLIVDDAIQSGRALETIARALWRADRVAYDKSTSVETKTKEAPHRSCFAGISSYAVVNRMGRAKSTFLGNIDSWSDNIALGLEAFVEYDLPVHSQEDCSVCDELRRYQRIQEALPTGGLGPLPLWIDAQIQRLQPIIVDTPRFELMRTQKFPGRCEFVFDNFRGKYLESSILIFQEKAERGCRTRRLLEALLDFSTHNSSDPNADSVFAFLRFAWCWFIEHWDRVSSDGATDQFFESLANELARIPSLAPDVCGAAAASYTHLGMDEMTFRQFLALIVEQLAATVAECGSDPSLAQLGAREALICSIQVMQAHLACEAGRHRDLLNHIYKCVRTELPDISCGRGDFQGPLRNTVLDALRFAEPGGFSFLGHLRLASKELLPARLREDGPWHVNRLSAHVALLKSAVLRVSKDAVLTRKILGSRAFLRMRSETLLRAVEDVLARQIEAAATVRECMSVARGDLEELCSALDSMAEAQEPKPPDNTACSWEVIERLASRVWSQVFAEQSPIYAGIRERNIELRTAFLELDRFRTSEGLAARLVLPEHDEDLFSNMPVAILANPVDFKNLLENHTIHVLKKRTRRQGQGIRVHVSAEPDEDEPDERYCIKILSNIGPFDEAVRVLTGKNGLRLERWDLARYGFTYRIDDPQERDDRGVIDGIQYTLELAFSFLRGLV